MQHIYEVRKSEQPVHWTVEVPGSKSITNRALLLAALTNDEVCLDGVLFSDDSRCFLQSLCSLGFKTEVREEISQVTVQGCGGRIPISEGEIYVGSAGTAARFLTAMLGVSDGVWRIQASPQMQRRPMKPLFEALLSLGAKIEWLGETWHLPVCITGAGQGQRAFGESAVLQMDISESTQFLSGFLLIAPMFASGLKIHILSEKKDGSYIRITRRMMAEFGVTAEFSDGAYMVPPGSVYRRKSYQIEPDVSAACYFYAAAAVTGGDALVKRVHRDGMQGDLKFLNVLEQMGCAVQDEPEGIRVTGPVYGDSGRILTGNRGNGDAPGSLTAGLRGIAVDMNDFSDQALTLAAIAPYADTPVRITNIAHIRGQESDRINAIVSNLARAGIACEEYPDGVKIFPGQPRPCRIETFDDHRVAMAFAVMGLRADGIVIENPACCRKTFEHYFDLLDELTGG
ncbi:MAG: 3-phosphoshikimate 1-carboxyvinyltransferase [Clostridiales bacterium]|nr:3-phosphoshikimate 1-carboxyvinyltransferase [Clostridiales bacterium]